MTRHPVALAAQTLGVPPALSIEIAAQAGFDAVGLLADDGWTDATVAGLKSALASRNIWLIDVEPIRLLPAFDKAAASRRLAWAAELGAPCVLVIGQDPVRSRLADNFASIAEEALSFGLRAALEPMPFREIATLREARELAEQAGPGAAVLVDNHHLALSGGVPADVAALPPELLPYVQLCDAPAKPAGDTREALMHEALHRRVLPGEGELPVAAFLAALPPGTPVSVEILSETMRERFGDPSAYATAILRATRRALDAAATAQPLAAGNRR